MGGGDMKATITALFASLAVVALAEDSAPTVPATAQEAPQPSARDRFLTLAKTITTGTSAAVVEATLAPSTLGKPRVSFHWCNRAGCVDKSGEAGSNRMWLNWSETEGEKDYRLGVMLCTPLTAPGSWKVAMVTVSTSATTPGAFGTLPKSENLYKDMDVKIPGCMVR